MHVTTENFTEQKPSRNKTNWKPGIGETAAFRTYGRILTKTNNRKLSYFLEKQNKDIYGKLFLRYTIVPRPFVVFQVSPMYVLVDGLGSGSTRYHFLDGSPGIGK